MKNSECDATGMLCENKRDIGYLVKALNHMFRRSFENALRKNGFEDITVMMGWIIGYLASCEGQDIYQKDLERRFHVGKSSLAGTLKIMEEKGYILRQSVKGDARLKRLVLTEKARQHCQWMIKEREELEQRVKEGIPGEDIDVFIRVIEKMRENLTDL